MLQEARLAKLQEAEERKRALEEERVVKVGGGGWCLEGGGRAIRVGPASLGWRVHDSTPPTPPKNHAAAAASI